MPHKLTVKGMYVQISTWQLQSREILSHKLEKGLLIQ